MAGNILVDFGPGSSMPFARCHASVGILTMLSLQHQAAGGSRIGHVTTGGLLQYRTQRRRHRLVVLQQFRDGYSSMLTITLQDAGIQPKFAAESGIKARGVNAESLGQIGHAHRVIASRMKETLLRFNSLFCIKLTGASRSTPRFCSGHYTNP